MEKIILFSAIFLGILEGLTEFVPISSTAHLLIASNLINFKSVKNNIFEIVIQLGAIIAICVIFRKKIFNLLTTCLQPKNYKFKQKELRFILNLFLAFIPTALVGIAFHKIIKDLFFTNFVIAISMITGGLVIILIDWKRDKDADKIDEEAIYKIKSSTAFFIGLFQVIAMIPGVSRSGSTIIGGILLGLNRRTSAEFSFFLAIPTIVAASLYDLFQNYSQLTSSNLKIIFIGVISSFISAIFVIKWFIKFISKNNFIPFGIYRIAVGIIILLFIHI